MDRYIKRETEEHKRLREAKEQALTEKRRLRFEREARRIKHSPAYWNIKEPTFDATVFKHEPPKSPLHSRVLGISVVGAPNAGKSTLVNRLVGQKVAAVSPKSQTTRERTLGVRTHKEVQLTFYDTPGIVSAQESKRINRDVVLTAWRTLQDGDMSAWLSFEFLRVC